MPIDPSIILGIRPAAPVQMADPLEQYSKGLTIRHLMQQGDIGELQAQTAKQGLADDAAMREAYKGDPSGVRSRLQAMGLYKGVQAYDKADLEKRKGEVDIAKDVATTGETNAKTVSKSLDNFRLLLPQINSAPEAAQWLRAQYADKTVGPLLASMRPLDDALSHIPTDPKEFKNWQFQSYSGMTDFMKDQRQKEQQVETNRHNVSSEGLTARGQNMTDARAREGNDIQRQAARTSIEKDENGNYFLVDKGTAKSTPVTGITAGQKPLNESQGKAAGMALRATRANDILNGLEDKGVNNRGVIKQAAASIPLIGGAAEMGVNMLPGALGGPSGQQQQVEQARRDFINAVLRVESGASISPGEFANAEKQYFPQPGDTADALKQKRANRQTAIESLNMQGGPKRPQGTTSGPIKQPDANGIKWDN